MNQGNWQRQGIAHAPRPKALPRPGIEPEDKAYGNEPVSIEEMNRRLGWEVATE